MARIMIIEDDPTWENFLKKTLKAAGHEIVKSCPDMILISVTRYLKTAISSATVIVFGPAGDWEVARKVFLSQTGIRDCLERRYERKYLLENIHRHLH